MARMLWLNWSGGGNLPPSLGIARVLTERGHAVAFAGRPEMVPRVERAGFRAIELTRAYGQADRYPANKWLPKAASFLTSPAVAEQIHELLAAEDPDLVIVDQMFPVALVEAARFGRPSVAVCHTTVWRALPMWRKFFAMLVGLRTEAGFAPMPSDLESLWMIQDKMIATTLKSLDDVPGDLGSAHKLCHVGPVLERERHGVRVALPWDDPSVPLVLVSFSTAPEQGSVAKFQNAIAALSRLPVRGVVTVGDSVDPAALTPSDNVVVVATADHDDLMRRASLVLTHGGHGTLMRALTHGLPMVVVPGLGGDQPINAAAVEDWKVGRALPADAGADMMREAVGAVLGAGSYRDHAAAIAAELAGADGARTGADEIEALLSSRLRKAS
ncbi:MAG TPA: nucleotide disphospho-sugar-binding domain-containing protein [Xanthobacteraceae bacterium]|nr:nucleotide disphospho-sugar-binding domain-containing protein [Xanthobacteraceae bacterium]